MLDNRALYREQRFGNRAVGFEHARARHGGAWGVVADPGQDLFDAGDGRFLLKLASVLGDI